MRGRDCPEALSPTAAWINADRTITKLAIIGSIIFQRVKRNKEDNFELYVALKG